MGIIINNRKHYFTRFPLGIVVIILMGFAPFIVSAVGVYFTELSSGQPCHLGNCYWAAIPWFGIFVTLPLSAILMIIYLIIIAIDAVKLKKQSE